MTGLTIEPTVHDWEVRSANGRHRLRLVVKFGWLRTATFWRVEPSPAMSTPAPGWGWREEIPTGTPGALIAAVSGIPAASVIPDHDQYAPVLDSLVRNHEHLRPLASLFGIVSFDDLVDRENALDVMDEAATFTLEALRAAHEAKKAPTRRVVREREHAHDEAFTAARRILGLTHEDG